MVSPNIPRGLNRREESVEMSRSVLGVSSFVVVVLSCAFASQAFAQDPPAPTPAAEPAAAPPPVAQQTATPPSPFERPGLDLGLRLGYALPFGKTDGNDNLGDGLSGAVPIVLEAGYRLNANFTVGALFQYGIAQVKENMTTNCGGAISCSGSVIRLGVEGIYNFNLDTPLTPWVGLGTGYEWMSISLSSGGQSGSASARGFEFVTLHAGGDYRLMPQLALGPFVSFSLAQYSSATAEAPGFPSMTMDLTDKKMHEWLQIGVRGKFGI
jgi:opacity protein-like surface antigen